MPARTGDVEIDLTVRDVAPRRAAGTADVDDWTSQLDALGIRHSGVKEPGHTRNAMTTFRDPGRHRARAAAAGA